MNGPQMNTNMTYIPAGFPSPGSPLPCAPVSLFVKSLFLEERLFPLIESETRAQLQRLTSSLSGGFPPPTICTLSFSFCLCLSLSPSLSLPLLYRSLCTVVRSSYLLLLCFTFLILLVLGVFFIRFHCNFSPHKRKLHLNCGFIHTADKV